MLLSVPILKPVIRQQVDSGRLNNVSEVVRAGLRLLEEHEAAKLQALREAIVIGLASEPSIPEDEVFDRLEAKYLATAEKKSLPTTKPR